MSPLTALLESSRKDVRKPAGGPLGRGVIRPSKVHVIGEELFRDVLVRERKRSDRSNQPLLLFLVKVGADPSISGAVISALTSAKRETDVLGWFDQQTVLGVIVPEIAGEDASVLRAIESRLKTELARRLHASALSKLSIEAHVHAPFRSAEDFKLVDRLIARPEPRDAGATIKRAIDVAGSLALLLILSPLMLFLAALIKLTSKGPVFFRQKRVGRMERPFEMLKFRTMRVGVDHALHHDFVTKFIKASGEIADPASIDADATPFKLRNDPRITPIGHLLRRTSLDEVPQLWNVLCGEMSLVGPRPPLPYEVEQYQPWHCRRVMEATPGITGLWQVEGRSRTTFDEMVRLDLRYARTRSLWNDIKILLATPAAVISGKGAA
jgi:lipopolysaccharide/colanic/teichoic acid biosynthesis glycosyltransferase